MFHDNAEFDLESVPSERLVLILIANVSIFIYSVLCLGH